VCLQLRLASPHASDGGGGRRGRCGRCEVEADVGGVSVHTPTKLLINEQ